MAATDETELSDDLYSLVSHVHESCNRDLLDAIAREELSFSQLQLLERLRTGMRPTVRQAAAILHVSCAGASRMIDSLARRGLVRREADDRDFRAKRLEITDRGLEAIQRLHAARLEGIQAFTRRLHPDDQKRLQTAIRRTMGRDELAARRPPRPA